MAVASAWAAVVLLSIVGASGSEATSCAYERCGSHNGKMCSSSSYPCCSSYGYCGNTAEHCGKDVAHDKDAARCSQALVGGMQTAISRAWGHGWLGCLG
mmetsp:Transcript_20969/g.55514  ORF Transcript_20969/g.55514 Transcript_20969/m.55514 type:complete len:99 (+) Transcript_20969:2-298(+)